MKNCFIETLDRRLVAQSRLAAAADEYRPIDAKSQVTRSCVHPPFAKSLSSHHPQAIILKPSSPFKTGTL
jgi:hypothetical protein